MGAEDLAQLLECLPSVHKPWIGSLGASTSTGHGSTCPQAQRLAGDWREAQEFKVIFGYKQHSRFT